MGCKGFQGFLISKPLPADEFIAFCEKVRSGGIRLRLKG